MKKILFILIYLLPSFCLAQTLSSQLPGAPTIELDLKNGLVKDDAAVPYATRLLFKVEVPDSVDKVPLDTLYAFYKDSLCDNPTIDMIPKGYTIDTIPKGYKPMGGWIRPAPTIGGQQKIAEFLSTLNADQFFLANRHYCLLIRRVDKANKSDPKQQRISLRTASKFADYVKLDFGLGYSPLPQALFGTAAVHIHLLPTNDFVNLSEHFPFHRQLLMRTSLFIGIAPVMLTSTTKQDIKSQTAVGNVVFGFGFRAPFYFPRNDKNDPSALLKRALSPKGVYIKDFMQAIRFNVGWILFKQADPSPLIVKDHTKIEPYLSLTYDASLSNLLAPIALLLGLK